MGDWRFRTIEEPHDYRQCVEIQEHVWGLTPPRLITTEMLSTCVRFGGTLLGTFDGGGRLLAFVFGFPSFWKDRSAEHSHMLAVRPSVRDRGIGRRLKRMQYERAETRGLDCITWTFDPLVARNAHLNLNRLGVRVEHYYVDLYGEGLGSPLHAGLGTDRFLVRWIVDRSTKAEPDSSSLDADSQVAPDSLPQAVRTLRNECGLRVPVDVDSGLDAVPLLVEVPFDVFRLRDVDPSLPRRWREATRSAFLFYLNRGLRVRRLIVDRGPEDPRAFYWLHREVG